MIKEIHNQVSWYSYEKKSGEIFHLGMYLITDINMTYLI